MWRHTPRQMPTRQPNKPAAEAPHDLERFRQSLRTGKPANHAYVMLMGLRTFETPELVRLVEKGLPVRTYDHLARNVGLRTERLLEAVDIPRRTLLRRREEGRFSPSESDRLLRISRIFGMALELFECDREAAVEWLTNAQIALGGAIPLDVMRTDIGGREVEALLNRLEYGVFS